MKTSDLLRTSYGNLGRRKVRTFLTTFGIFVGIVTIVSMVSIAAGVQREIERTLGGLGLETVYVYPAANQTEVQQSNVPSPGQVRDQQEQLDSGKRLRPLDTAALDALKKIPNVVAAAPQVSLASYINISLQNGDKSGRVSIRSNVLTPGQGQQLLPPPKILAGADMPVDGAKGVVLPVGAAQKAGLVTGDIRRNAPTSGIPGYDGEAFLTDAQQAQVSALIGTDITLVVASPREQQTFRIKVVGVNDSIRTAALGYEEALAVKGWYFNKPNIMQTDGFDSVIVTARDANVVGQVVTDIRKLQFQVSSVQAFIDLASKTYAILQTMLASIGLLALFVASLGVINTMIMAIYERTKEIGVLKALGASRGDIARIFMIEAALIGFLGGAFGLLFGWLLSLFIDWVLHRYLDTQQITFVGPLTYVPLWLMVGSVIFATLVGLVAGLYPASRAAKLDPVASLRYE